MKRRGYLMPMALMILTVLTLAGLGFMGAQSRNYQASIRGIAVEQARALAQAGIEDARVKLTKDLEFPPVGDEGQQLFSYQETLTGLNDGPEIGTFNVTIDSRYAGEPYYIVVVKSVGHDRSSDTYSTIVAEFDLCPFDRSDPNNPNPRPYRVMNWNEESL